MKAFIGKIISHTPFTTASVNMHTLTGVPEDERPIEFQKKKNNHVPLGEQRQVERLGAEIEG